MISDWIFTSIAMLLLIAFVGVISVYVMEPDLWLVSLLVLAIVVFFTVRDLRAGGSHLEDESDESSVS